MAPGCENSDRREAEPGSGARRRRGDGGDAEAPSSRAEPGDRGLGTGEESAAPAAPATAA
jgi:hypothetical protein